MLKFNKKDIKEILVMALIGMVVILGYKAIQWGVTDGYIILEEYKEDKRAEILIEHSEELLIKAENWEEYVNALSEVSLQNHVEELIDRNRSFLEDVEVFESEISKKDTEVLSQIDRLKNWIEYNHKDLLKFNEYRASRSYKEKLYLKEESIKNIGYIKDNLNFMPRSIKEQNELNKMK